MDALSPNKLHLLGTSRLVLRRWKDDDRAPFAVMNRDPRVMEFMPRLLDLSESNHFVDRIEKHFQTRGFGLYAAELRESQAFAGFIGLSIPGFDAPFMPAVEIGWRLAYDCWGRGLATEGATEVARHAFLELSMSELVSFTSRLNLRSVRVMEKLGMTRNPSEDFEHPNLVVGHPLRLHVLYRLSRADWVKHAAS